MSNLDILLKIGGSVLTAKNTTDIINQEIIRELSNEIKSIYNAGYSICIVTGVGNLGHQTVAKYGIQKGDNKSIERRLGLVDAQLQVNIIRNVLLQSLYLAEIPCVQLYASSIIISNNMMITQTFFDSIQGFLKSNIVPVISGDVVSDASLGFSVLSGDDIFLKIAEKFQPKLMVFGTNVDGVYTSDPFNDKEAKLINKINISTDLLDQIDLQQSSIIDVSGSMKGKISKISKFLYTHKKAEIHVINLLQPKNITLLLQDIPFNHSVIMY